jgi:hypothetical protein
MRGSLAEAWPALPVPLERRDPLPVGRSSQTVAFDEPGAGFFRPRDDGFVSQQLGPIEARAVNEDTT